MESLFLLFISICNRVSSRCFNLFIFNSSTLLSGMPKISFCLKWLKSKRTVTTGHHRWFDWYINTSGSVKCCRYHRRVSSKHLEVLAPDNYFSKKSIRTFEVLSFDFLQNGCEHVIENKIRNLGGICADEHLLVKLLGDLKCDHKEIFQFNMVKSWRIVCRWKIIYIDAFGRPLKWLALHYSIHVYVSMGSNPWPWHVSAIHTDTLTYSVKNYKGTTYFISFFSLLNILHIWINSA